MFSRSNSRVTTAACVAAMVMVMMMMMMKTEAAAMPKTHRSAVLETVPLQLNPEVLGVRTSFGSLANSSISPWTYNKSHHESLYPPDISEAHCLLRGCLNSEGQEDLNLESKPIKKQVLVLRRVRVAEVGSGTGYSYHFRLEYRVVTVGCTCVRPSVQSP